MYNPSYITSTLSIRYRGPISYSFNDYSYDSRFNNHLIRSSQSCCCVCCSTSYVYRNPLNPRFVCGSRQSSLIHLAASRRFLIQPEPDPYCCGCVKERDFGERRFERKVFEGRSFDFETAEMMLSLLIEERDLGEECCSVREIDCSSSRRLDFERKVRKSEKKKKDVSLGLLSSDLRSKYEVLRTGSRENEARNGRKEDRESEDEKVSRMGNHRERDYSSSRRLDFERKGRESGKKKKKDVSLGLLSSDSRSKYEGLRIGLRENEARNGRKEDRKSEDEEVFQMRNQYLRGRKSGSSCSSYHTCMSLGEESDSDSEIHVGKSESCKSSGEGYKRDSKESEKVVYKDEIKGNLGSHKMIESDWRKKTEKKLDEVAIEDVCEGSSYYKKVEMFDDKSKKFIRDSGTSDQRSDYRFSIDKSNQVSKIEDKSSKRTNISRETDSRRKFLQSAEISDDPVSRRDDYSLRTEKSNQVSQIEDINVNRTNISQSRYEDKVKRQEDSYYLKSENDSRQIDTRRKFQKSIKISDDRVSRRDDYKSMSEQTSQVIRIDDTKVRTNISQEQYEDKVKNEEDLRKNFRQSAEISDDGMSRRDDCRLNTLQSDQVSQIQEINVSRTNILGAQNEEKVKKWEDRSSLISSSAQDTEYQYYMHSEDDSRQMNSRKKLQQSTEITEISDDLISRRDDCRSSTDQSNQVSQIHDINASTNISLEQYQESLKQMDSGRKLRRSTDITATQTQDIQSAKGSVEMSTITPEDALGSARRFQKSSSKLVDEFLEKALHEASTSKNQIEKSTFEEEDKALKEPSESGNSEVKGPSEEIWDEVAPSIQEPIDTQIQVPEKTSPTENKIVKRSGRSLWNVFSDIVTLHWSSHPKTTNPSLRNSPNQSTSEAWFSGQDRYESSEENIKDRNKKISRESIPTPTESQGEGYMSSTEENPKMDKSEKVGSEMKRRMFQRTDQVIKDRFDEWEEAFMVESEQRKVDEGFMREALLEARKAGDMWEVPVGAVLVQHGKIIARGYNLVEELRDSTAHAEMICIREASNKLQSWRLADTTLYVTLEPCPMCAGAILQARVDTVVWGAPNKLLGADGSWIRLFPDGSEGGSTSDPTYKPPAPVHPFHPKITIRRGVLGAECADVMQHFFQLRRRKKDKKQLPETLPSPPSCLPISNHPSKILNRMQGAFHFMFCL